MNSKSLILGRSGGQVVSVLSFYSDDTSSNPTEVDNFSVKFLLSTKINKRMPGWPIFKKIAYIKTLVIIYYCSVQKVGHKTRRNCLYPGCNPRQQKIQESKRDIKRAKSGPRWWSNPAEVFICKIVQRERQYLNVKEAVDAPFKKQ